MPWVFGLLRQYRAAMSMCHFENYQRSFLSTILCHLLTHKWFCNTNLRFHSYLYVFRKCKYEITDFCLSCLKCFGGWGDKQCKHLCYASQFTMTVLTLSTP